MGSIDYREQGEKIRPLIVDLFDAAKKEGRPLYVAAPMVRYSKLSFRLLLHQNSVDVTYTPMLLAHEFIRSPIARDSDFTTHALERRRTADGRQHALIAQFASSDPEEFARAADMIAPWVDGVNLNCGCPQGWACREGIGCALMEEGERVAGIVKRVRERVGRGKSVSVKIRIHKDLDQTIRWIRTVQDAGIDYITIHGRLRQQRSSTPPNYAAIAQLRPYITVPLLANGDVTSLTSAHTIASLTHADGVMAARGLLENPALFAGYEVTPVACVQEFMQWAVRCPMPFPLVLHHVSEMTAKMEGMGKRGRRELMGCGDLVELVEWVEGRWGL